MVDGHAMFFNSLQSSAYDNVYVISKTVCYNYHEAVLLSHFQRGMNDIVAGVQQYHSSLVSNLRSQIEQVLKKHSENTSGHLQKELMDVFDSFVDPFTVLRQHFNRTVL